jgi:hypothetical protein
MVEVAYARQYSVNSTSTFDLNTTYSADQTVLLRNDAVAVEFKNVHSANGRVTFTLADTEGNGDLAINGDNQLDVPGDGNTHTIEFFTFGYRADGVSPRTDVYLTIALENVDNANEGLEVGVEIFT